MASCSKIITYYSHAQLGELYRQLKNFFGGAYDKELACVSEDGKKKTQQYVVRYGADRFEMN